MAMARPSSIVVAAAFCLVFGAVGGADVMTFFDPSQTATTVSLGVNFDTIRSNGYLFTYSRDKLFTGGLGGGPIGRPVYVDWPDGVEGQAITTGPSMGNARIVIERVDGDVFDLIAFTAKLLANTFGTGASIEIMPSLNGEDGFPDPLYFDASGTYGNTFSYDTSPNYLGSTALLTGFDRYTATLFVDFAYVALTLQGAPVLVPEPSAFAATAALGAVWLCRRPRRPRGARAGP
jgi:hypothetical protein